MRIMLAWDYYPAYLYFLYRQHPGGAAWQFARQSRLLLDDYFNWPTYLIPHLKAAGHEVLSVVGNARPLLMAWARENGYTFAEAEWDTDILREQIRRFRPDVLWCGGAPRYCHDVLPGVRRWARLVVAWIGAAWPPAMDFSSVDCVFTNIPSYMGAFQKLGKPCEVVLPCFDERILRHCGARRQDISISFVGSMNTSQFARRLEVLQYVHRRCRLDIWAERPAVQQRPLPLGSFLSQLRFAPLLLGARRHAAVYGRAMFDVLGRSRITLNAHARHADGLASNNRLFEATGMGALLATEAAPNLSSIFEPDREVLAYASLEELVDKLRYYSGHEEERARIARAGQARTLSQHASGVRAKQVVDLFARYLA
jgi:hypothetical protein